MSRLAVEFLDQGLHRAMLDAMPIPVFLVDADASILEYNAAARQFLGSPKSQVLHRHLGDVLNCRYAVESARGCDFGRACPACGLRRSIQAASRGRRVTRRSASFERRTGNHRTKKVDLRIGCHPFTFKGRSFNLLVLEGLDG